MTKPEGKVDSGTKKKKESIQVSPLGVRNLGRNGGDGDEEYLGWRRGGSGNKRRLTQELIESTNIEVSKYSEERMNPSKRQIEIGQERLKGDEESYVSESSIYFSSTRDNGSDDYTADPQALKRVLESSAFIAGSTKDQSIHQDDHTADPLALKRVLESSDFLAREVRYNNETAGHSTVEAVLNSGNDFLVNELPEDDNILRSSDRRITADINDVQRLLGDISDDEAGQKKDDMTCEILSIAKKDKDRRITADSADLRGILSALDEDKEDGRRGGSTVVDAVKPFTISQNTADMSGLQSETSKPRMEDKEIGSSSSGGSSNRRLTADLSELQSVFADVMEGKEQEDETTGAMNLPAITQGTARPSVKQSTAMELRPEDDESGSSRSSRRGSNNRRLTADTLELKSVFADIMEEEAAVVGAMELSTAISKGTTCMSAEAELRPEDEESTLSSPGGGNRRRTANMLPNLGEEREVESSSDSSIAAKWKKSFSSNGRGDRHLAANMTEVKLVLAGLDEEMSKVTTATTQQQQQQRFPSSPPRGCFEISQTGQSISLTSLTASPVKMMARQGAAGAAAFPPSIENLLRSVDEAKEEEDVTSNAAPEERGSTPDPLLSEEFQAETHNNNNNTCTQAHRDSLHFLTHHFTGGATSEDMPLSPSGLPAVSASSLKSCLSSKKRNRRFLRGAPDPTDKLTPRKKPFAVEQDAGSGKRVGFGTLSAVEFRSGSPSTKLTPMPTRAARATFHLDGQNDLKFPRRDARSDEEDEDTATNTMILDEWEEEAKAEESRRVAQVEAAAAKRGSPSPSSRRSTLMPPRRKPFNVKGLVKNLQQEESFCDDSIAFRSSMVDDDGDQQNRSLASLSNNNFVSSSSTIVGGGATSSPLSPISVKVDCSGGNDPPKVSPAISVTIRVKQSPQKVIGGTAISSLSRAINVNDESSCCSDMDVSDANMSPQTTSMDAAKQLRKKVEKSSRLSHSTTPSTLRDITNQVDLYETEMSFLSSDQDSACVSDGEEDEDRTQQLEPTLGGLLKGLEAEGSAAATGTFSSAQAQKNLSDGIEEDRKENHTMELEPSLGGLLARLDQAESSPLPAVAFTSTNDDSSTSFSIVPDAHDSGLSPDSRAEQLKRTVEGLMLLTTPNTLTAKDKSKSSREDGKRSRSDGDYFVDDGEEKNTALHSFNKGNSSGSTCANAVDAGSTLEVVERNDAGNENLTCLGPSSVELKKGQDNDVLLTTDGVRTSFGKRAEIDEPTPPLALSVVMEEDESDLMHSTEFTESTKHSNDSAVTPPEPSSAGICVNESSINGHVNSKAAVQESNNVGSKSMSCPTDQVNPPPPLSFESLLNFCMPEECRMVDVQSALLPVSSSVKELPSDKRGCMVQTLLHAVELHLLTYATEELVHQVVPEGVKQMADALLENKADQPIVRRIEAAAAGVHEDKDDEKLGERLGALSGQVKRNVMASMFTLEMRWIDMLSARTREVASEIDDKARSLLRGKAYLELLDKQLDAIEAQVESECSKQEAEAKEVRLKSLAKVMADIDASGTEKEELEGRVRHQEEVQALRKRCAEAEEALAAVEKDAYQEEENVIDLENKISFTRGLHNWGNPLKLWSSEITIPFVPCYPTRQTVHALRATLRDSGDAIASVISLAAPAPATAGGPGPLGRRKRANVQKNVDIVPPSAAGEMISTLVFDSNSGIFSQFGAAAGSTLSAVKCFSDIPCAATAIERIQGRSNSLVNSVDWLVSKAGFVCRVEESSCGKGEAGGCSSVILHVDLMGKGTLSFDVDTSCASLGFETELSVNEGAQIDEDTLLNAKQSAQRIMASSGGGVAILRCVDSVCQVMGLPSIRTALKPRVTLQP